LLLLESLRDKAASRGCGSRHGDLQVLIQLDNFEEDFGKIQEIIG
jgi:hypothetical protein